VIKIPKVILEKSDIVDMIKKQYKDCDIISGLEDDTEIIIRVDMYKSHVTLPPVVVQPKPPQEPRAVTTPGGQMGNNRGRLPKF